MSKDYTFDGTLTSTVGHATKKAQYDNLVENTKEIDQRLEGLPFLGDFLPKAGSAAIAYDGNGRVSTITYSTSPVGTVTIVYDDGNGGRVDYVEFACTDPVAVTIRNTYSYTGDDITGIVRTVT